ncbi:NAD(P)-dependent oxidoreductase [Acidisoma silvae]|uniref:NAD(P)-dependent oxidoreductase n=1 Tax=Acidisoma silvae TaxID=2802396 RepID=A0A963YXB4_9PROT|nr:NAD(P)-dependent oxidoreductase [Acidisoma silvae]MCB8877853.1 NAD(P)-dependent oxidoreductase [Acidisoma silvae]
MSERTTTTIGFIGLGTMGEPMAMNLAQAGVRLLVWNRSNAKCARLASAGAAIAASLDELFARCETIVLMLADGAAIDAVLDRIGVAFASRVHGHLIVNMGTVPPAYSAALAAEIAAVGGRYVEAPVSGSRQPAEAGQLVAMVAGMPEDVTSVLELVGPMCSKCFACGAVPGALAMKLAVNTFLITMVTGLVEAAHFAGRHGLDLGQLVAVLNAGPMASEVSRTKSAKLLAQDFSRHAGISDVLKNNRLIIDAAREANAASPLMDACLALYGEVEDMGLVGDDMVAVIRAFERRSGALP